jgi:hypothetical protein
MRLLAILAAFAAVLGLNACFSRTPGVSGQQYVQPAFMHANFIGSNTCSSCHAADMPGPIEGEIHGGGNDCGMCHVPKDDGSGWLPVIAFTHVPAPTTCLECHAEDRPPSPHPQTVDCVLCHKFGSTFTPLPGATNNGPPPSSALKATDAD